MKNFPNIKACKSFEEIDKTWPSKNSTLSFVVSCFLHLGVIALLLWNPLWNKTVSQGELASQPLIVSVVTLPADHQPTPEKIVTKIEPQSGDAEKKLRPINKISPLSQFKTSKKEVIEKQQTASMPANAGSLQAVKQQAEFATAGTNTGEVSYNDKIRAWLEKHKAYPKRARLKGLEGQVIVSFTFNREGQIISKRLVNSSGHDILDQAAFDAMDAANPLPPIPQSMKQNQITLTVPFGFNLI